MSKCSQITDQDRAEATSVTAHGSGHLFEIQLGHLCNNRCVFCSSGQLTQMKLARRIPVDPMLAAIEQARAAGARKVTFLGGEPTLHKDFLVALKRSVELGFEEIVIFTNGVLLPHPGFIDKVVALGKFEWRISIQGGNEDAHVAVTKRADSFRRIVQGLKMLRERGQRVTANICVNEHSYRSLPDFPALVREHDIRQLHVDIVRPSSTGERSEEYLREIMPRYSVMAPDMSEMLARFERDSPGFDVNIGNLPFCVLPRWAHRINHGGDETVTKACDDQALEVSVDKYEWHASMRQHVPQCASCVFRPRCTGVYSTYLELYGDEELQPVTLAQLNQLGVTQHHFVLLSEPALAPLEAAPKSEMPAGWSLESWFRDGRQAGVDAEYQSAGGGRVTLHFAAPGSTAPAALVTDQYRMTVAIAPEVAAGDASRLLAWVADRLALAPGIELQQPVDAAAVVSAHQAAQLTGRGRARMAELVRRAEQQAHFGHWHVEGHRDEGAASIVELGGPDGGRIDVVFSIRAQAGRPQIAVDARLGERTSAHAARAVIEELVSALRDPAHLHDQA